MREIKPIQLIFTSPEDLEKLLRETFKDALGTIGLVEFEQLKTQGLDLTTILNYVSNLKKENILETPEFLAFKRKIANVFKPQKQPISQFLHAFKR